MSLIYYVTRSWPFIYGIQWRSYSRCIVTNPCLLFVCLDTKESFFILDTPIYLTSTVFDPKLFQRNIFSCDSSVGLLYFVVSDDLKITPLVGSVFPSWTFSRHTNYKDYSTFRISPILFHFLFRFSSSPVTPRISSGTSKTTSTSPPFINLLKIVFLPYYTEH